MSTQIKQTPPAVEMPGYWVYVNLHRDGIRNWVGNHWRALRETQTGIRAIDLHGIRYSHLPALLTRRRYDITRVDAATAAKLDASHGGLLRTYVGKVWGTRTA